MYPLSPNYMSPTRVKPAQIDILVGVCKFPDFQSSELVWFGCVSWRIGAMEEMNNWREIQNKFCGKIPIYGVCLWVSHICKCEPVWDT